MKKTGILILFFFALCAFAQKTDSWTVSLNGKTRLAAKSEDMAKNLVTISRTELKKGGTLQVNYKPAMAQPDMERTIALYSDTDEELATAKGNRLNLSNARLRSLSAGRTKLYIYTMALPLDPRKRALVRVRRVHLCTISVK